MRPTRRSYVTPLKLICALAASALAAAFSCQPSHARQSPTPEPRVFHVTVTDSKGNLIEGVKRESVTAFDGGEPCELVSFVAEDAPASVMFLVDTSASAFGLNRGGRGRQRIAALKSAVSAFITAGNPSNEYFVTAFNKSPQVLLDGSADSREVLGALDRLASADLNGVTALYDALYLSLDKLSRRPTRKHVLVLLSDGQENVSSYTLQQLTLGLKESDVIVYPVGVFLDGDSDIAFNARRFLEELADTSGGAVFYPGDEADMKAALARISVELRSQYEVAFKPTSRAKSDGWHDVRFKLGELRDKQGRKVKTNVRARRGFYEPGAPRKSKTD